MATLHVDGASFDVDPNGNLLEVLLGLGFDLPYFCWHPALGSVGACRQCAVKLYTGEEDTRGKIVMACMTPVTDGARVSIRDPEAVEFRARTVEWLMLNHPHDCPVCDEGGECHLQDMTVMTGHTCRRNRFPKRTHHNQYLGPFLNHEMNRCIQCYRCVRFYRDYAGGRDLDVFGAHDAVYFGRHADGVLENEFSGNLVEVCPTGVFTDKTLQRHYTRKWDLTFAPSVCPHCSVGCNISPGARYGTVRRIVNRYHPDVNGYFLCDRGRFGYEFTTHERRLRTPLLRSSEGQQPCSAAVGLSEASRLLGRCERIIGIGSPRASLEANFALLALVGRDNFSTGMNGREATLVRTALNILRTGPSPSASVKDTESSDAVLVLGEDVTHTAPRVALAIRQAVLQEPRRAASRLRIPDWHDQAVRNVIQDDRGPLFLATVEATKLEDVARRTLRALPLDIARLGFAVAHAIERGAPPVDPDPLIDGALVTAIVQALLGAEHPLVVAGVSLGTPEVLHAAANVAWALRRAGRAARILLVVPECNSMGVVLLGERDLEEAITDVSGSPDMGVIVIENDLARRIRAVTLQEVLSGLGGLVAIDALSSETTERADVVLPCGTFAETEGTLVSYEGRAQRYSRVLDVAPEAKETWRWLAQLGERLGRGPEQEWKGFDDVVSAMSGMAELAEVSRAAPRATKRWVGSRIPRQLPRYSGRTAIDASQNVHEPKPPEDVDSPLAFSMEGFPLQPPPSVTPYVWSPGWNSPQALNKFQEEIGGKLRGGTPGVLLFRSDPDSRPAYFIRAEPSGSTRARSKFLAVGAPHVFGSEELSNLAPGIAERAPFPNVTLNLEDLAELGFEPGTEVRLSIGDSTFKLTVSASPTLAPGVALLPLGLRGMPFVALPAPASIEGGH